MKVKVLDADVINGSVWAAGSIIELPDDRAKQLIAERRVIAADAEPELPGATSQPIIEDEAAAPFGLRIGRAKKGKGS